jgi:hypothetical protein
MRMLEALKLSFPAVVLATLCCLSPLVLVLFGAGVSSFGVLVFTRTLGPYEWVFFLAGALLLIASVWFYLRSKGVCTLSQARVRRNEVVNTLLVVGIVSIVAFIVLYGAVAVIGERLGIWATSGG